MLVDSHCHLDYFTDAEVADVVQRAHDAGVTTLLTIGTRLRQAAQIRELTDRFPGVWGTVGIHPHNAGEGPLPTPEQIAAETAHPRIVGIGESGLDYFYNKSPQAAQIESFRHHIRAAQITGLPLVIHARDADADIITILNEERAAGGAFAFLLHCFSSTRALAEAAVVAGGYVSLSGILTFPKSEEIRAIARDVPLDRLLVETDSPYLAPVPYRGKRNEPAWTVETTRVLAGLHGLTFEAMAAQTTENFKRLFSKISG